MKQFSGFPSKMSFTPLPNIFFSAILPQINDMVELKVTLYLFETLYRKRGYPRFITYRELLGNTSLMASIRPVSEAPEVLLCKALEMAIQRKTIIRLALVGDDSVLEDVYLLNSDYDKQIADKISRGELQLKGLKATGQAGIELEARPDIFTIYEENIGMLTPMIVEELCEAERAYPAGWIREAIKEATTLNKRNWRYISRILERWSSEGKSDGAHRRDSKKTDPDKYIKGKYGHMVRR
ncbi:DnaD domain-containing protein [Chloroflexota bacterium]